MNGDFFDNNEFDGKENTGVNETPRDGSSSQASDERTDAGQHPTGYVPPHAESSFTPNTSFSDPSVISENETPYTAKKQPKPVTRSGLAVACVCVAFASSILTASIFSFGLAKGQFLNPSSGSTSTKTSIVTESTDEAAVQAVAEAVSPSVVGIVVATSSQSFFGTGTSSESEGSGIIYSEDGYIITNYHVISDAVESNGKISVYLESDSHFGNGGRIRRQRRPCGC